MCLTKELDVSPGQSMIKRWTVFALSCIIRCNYCTEAEALLIIIIVGKAFTIYEMLAFCLFVQLTAF